MPKILYSFLFPVHNERPYLTNQLKLFLKEIIPLYQLNFEILLIENGSNDGSSKLVAELTSRFSFIKSHSLLEPSYGMAIKKGINAAVATKLFVLNVDYFDIDFIKKSVSLLDHIDIVIGSKTLSHSQDKRAIARRLTTYFFNVLLRLVLNYPGTDTHGIKAFRKSDLLLKNLEKCRTKNELFDTELVLRMTHQGAIFVDLPQEVTEVRPSRYSGMRRIYSTAQDLLQALSSKYLFQNSFESQQTDADDFGISHMVNKAILHEVKNGKVQIVSIMANLADKEDVAELKKQAPNIQYSLHFNLLRGRPSAPVSKVASLVNSKGHFFPLPLFLLKMFLGSINFDEIKIELLSQWRKLQSMGISATLLSSEQHLHTFSPINELIAESIKKTSIKKIRSISSTRNYLAKKTVKSIVYRILLILFATKYKVFTEFSKKYDAYICHPGTNYD